MDVHPRVWQATGRFRVHRYLCPTAGPMGTPGWRWAVIGPLGEHIGSAAGDKWAAAQDAADYAARHPEERWWL